MENKDFLLILIIFYSTTLCSCDVEKVYTWQDFNKLHLERWDRVSKALWQDDGEKIVARICTRQIQGPATHKKDDCNLKCDRHCCNGGYLTGFCMDGSTCKCTSNVREAECGQDGRFLGIDCPIDSSACWRSCCLKGNDKGGFCGGFLGFECVCY